MRGRVFSRRNRFGLPVLGETRVIVAIRLVRWTHHTEPLPLVPWMPVMPSLLQVTTAHLALSAGKAAGRGGAIVSGY